jgi:hypothetical protein
MLGVDMVSETDGWAVGYYTDTTRQSSSIQLNHDVAARWRFGPDVRWRYFPAFPSYGSTPTRLFSVDAISANNVWAVGTINNAVPSPHFETLIERFDGTQFTRVPSPNVGTSHNYLVGVHGSAPNNVYAVGYYDTGGAGTRTLAQRWNGSIWQIETTPNPGGFLNFLNDTEVVTSTGVVWAAGQYYTPQLRAQPMVLRRNAGGTWEVIPNPSLAAGEYILTGVSVVGPDSVYIGGYSFPASPPFETDPFLLHWNGIQLNLLQTPALPGSQNIYGIDFTTIPPSGVFGMAVGAENVGSGDTPFVLIYDGTTFRESPFDFITHGAIGQARVAEGYLSLVVGQQGLPNGSFPTDRELGSGIETLAAFYEDPCGGPQPTPTPGGPTPTRTPTLGPPTATPTACTPHVYSDVPTNHTFYPFVTCLSQRGVIGGYSDCTFRPGNEVTRGQIAKMVSIAANFNDDVTGRYTYTDVPSTHTFWLWIERLSLRGVMGGYACGGQNEPCDPQNRPYFRPQNNATRGQVSKIVSNAAGYSDTPPGQTFTDVSPSNPFWLWIERLATRGIMGGYPCGGQGEACDPQNRPYFRPGNNVTRGQSSKIVANTFFPNCVTPRR